MANQEAKQILSELKHFLTESKFNRVKNLLNFEIAKIESEIAAEEKKAKVSIGAEKVPIRPKVDLREHAFDESDKYVKIFIPFNAAKITDENVGVEFTSDSFVMTITTDAKDYKFTATSLLKPINIEKSYKKVKPQDEMVALYLKKEKEGVNWGCLTTTEKRLKDSKSKTFEEDKSSEDPMGGLMNIMKKMYDTGDSDMKRTIAKAWTEGQEKSRQNPML